MRISNSLPALVALSLSTSAVAAYNDPGTDYTDASQKQYVWNEALQPVSLVNSILCFTAQFNATDFANAGPYIVLADEAACFDEEKDGSSGQSSGSSGTPAYVKAVANVTRASDTDPMQISVWLPEMKAGDGEEAIKFKSLISEGASEENPFGRFSFNFDFYDTLEPGGTQTGGGEVRTVDTIPGSIGFTLYESGNHGGHVFTQRASVVLSADKTSGTAITSFEQVGFGGQSFALSFNSTHVLTQSVSGDIAALPFQSGDYSGTCLSRTEFDQHVYRYDLFDAVTGAKVAINSGFPVKYDSNNDGTYDSYGHAGYWGLWTEKDNAVANGDTVVRDAEGDGTNTEYTVVKAPGRLIKNTAKQLALTEARGVNFSYWDENVYSSSFDQWVVKYLTVALDGVGTTGFYIVGGLNWGENGPTVTAQTPSLLNISAGESLHMWSEQLGGPVKYLEGAASLSYFEQTFLNGSEPELTSGTLSLSCFDRCPVGTMEASDLQNYQGSGSPYSATAPDVASAVGFTFATSGANILTLVRDDNSEPVQFAAGVTEETLNNSPHNWGVRSGPMVTADVAALMSNVWDIYDPGVVSVYYEWETGLKNWNQLTVIKDSNGDVVQFDKPIQFAYVHTHSNDRSGDAGEYFQQTFMLNYGGNGDLWGIPHETTSGRWFAKFAIADGVVMGASNQYVIKAREMELTMKAAPGQCSSMTITAPDAPVPDSVTGSADIGDMPVVTGDPSVVGGVNQ